MGRDEKVVTGTFALAGLIIAGVPIAFLFNWKAGCAYILFFTAWGAFNWFRPKTP